MVFREKQNGSLVGYSILFLIFVFGLVLRFSNYQFFYADFFGHFNFFDPDSYYQLRRLVYFLENFPQSLSFDPLMDWPQGGPVDWPDISLWLYGLPLKIFGVHSYKALELGASMLSIFYGMITAIFVYLCSRKFFDKSFQCLTFFLAVLSPLLIRYSCLGQVDHHIFESLLVIISLWLVFQIFDYGKMWAAYVLGLLWALGFGISSSTIFTLTSFLLGIYLVWGDKKYSTHFLAIGASFFVCYGLVFCMHQGRGSFLFDLKMPSLFQALASLGVFLFCSIPFFVEKPKAKLYAYSSLLFLGLASLLIPAFQKVVFGAFAYVFERQGMIKYVVEANPLFFNFGSFDPHFAFQNLSFLFPLLLLAPLALLRWKRLSSQEKILFVCLTFLMIPALLQRRFTHFVLPIYLLTSVWLLTRLLQYIEMRGLRISNLVSLSFVCMFLFPNFQYGFTPEALAAHRVDFSLTRFFTEKAEIQKDKSWSRLANPSDVAGGIWANPNLGHLLSYVTGYGVVTNPFYHGRGLRRDFELRTVESEEDFVSKLQEYKIEYAFVLNDFQYFEMLHYLMSQDPSYFVEERDGAKHFQIDQIERFEWVRLILQTDEELASYEEILGLQFMENYFYNFTRVFKSKS